VRTVILAAGDGGRLNHATARLPKPLVSLAGRPIVQYTIDAIAGAGLREICVVTGYLEEQLREHLAALLPATIDASFVSNSRFHEPASLSLMAAREYAGNEPFLLLMADHVFETAVLRALLNGHVQEPGVSLVAADRQQRDPAYVAEATRLVVRDGFVTAIGKGLDEWDALDAGAFVLTPAVWKAADAVLQPCELSVIFSEMARRGELRAAPIDGAWWYDIDTPDDLAAAEKLLRQRAVSR
jgi:choline kinase